jgi:hypothetical protein
LKSRPLAAGEEFSSPTGGPFRAPLFSRKLVMASRENQGLQAALILFVLITIALAVTTYVYFRKAEEEGVRATAAEEKAQKASQDVRQTIDERNKLKEYLGFDMTEEMAVIDKRFQEDMAKFGADYPDTDPKNYRTLPDYVLGAAMKRSEEIVEANRREQQALAEKQATDQRTAGLIQAKDAENQQLVATYTGERQAFNAERQRITTGAAQVAGQITEKNQQIAAGKTSYTQMEDRFKTQISEMEKVLEAMLVQKREREQTNFETSDGRITYVNHADRTVWINLGIADGLQRHTSFSVYDQNVHEYSPEFKKGDIEVTKLIDRHLAEARIVNDEIRNPIVPGDMVYTPAWRPGVFMHFAVAGFVDINGDGLEDKELLRNIIHANGGVIDAEVDAAGNRVGEMTVNTRYLILGERPDEKSGARNPAALAGYSDLYSEATTKGVELMPLARFLGLMGYKAGSKTVQLGGRGGAEVPPPAGPAQPRAGNGAPGGAEPFRPRTPGRGTNGAF